MNLFLVFISITIGTTVGVLLNKRSGNKAKYFREVVGLCDSLERNLMFRRDKLQQALTETNVEQKLLNKHIEQFCQFLTSGGDKLVLEKGCLKDSELTNVQKFFLSLGGGDSATEHNILASYKEEFGQLKSKYKESHDRLGGAYTKLGFLAGLALGILLI